MNQNNELIYHPKDKRKLAELREQINQIESDFNQDQKLQLLKDDKIIKIFQVPLNQVFASTEANISEAFQKNNITKLTYKDFQLNQYIVQFLAETAQDLKISVLEVFTSFDEIVLENPVLQKGLQNFHLLQCKYNDIKNLIYQMYLQNRKQYLLCLKDILQTFYYQQNFNQLLNEIIQQFLIKANDKDQIFKTIIQNLKLLTQDKQLSNYDWNNVEKYVEFKMEENQILEECLQLILINENIELQDESLLEVIDIFKTRNFQSFLSQLMQVTKVNNLHQNLKIAQFNKQSILNQKIILIAIQLRKFGQQNSLDGFESRLQKLNDKFSANIDYNILEEQQDFVLPILVLKLLNQHFIYESDKKQNQGQNKSEFYQKFMDFIDHKYNNIVGDTLLPLIEDLISELKESKSLFESVQKFVFKKMLELLWALFKSDSILFTEDFQLKEPSILFLMLFKEMASDCLLYQQFLNEDFMKETNLGSFIDYYIASYPLENQDGFIYCQLIDILLQNHSAQCHKFIFPHISRLQFITIEKLNTELLTLPAKQIKFKDFGYKSFKLQKDQVIQGFNIEQDSTHYQTQDNMYLFEVNFNFFDHMLEKLMYCVLRNDWEQHITIEQFQSYFKLFCKVINVSRVEKVHFNLRKNHRIMKTFVILNMIIMDQRNFELAYSNDLFKALKTYRNILYGNYSILYKNFLLMTFYIHQGQDKNILISIFEQTQELAKSRDFLTTDLSKYVYKIQRELLLIFQVFVADDNLFQNQQDLNQVVLGYSNNKNQQILTRTTNYFTKLYNRDIAINDDEFFQGITECLKEFQAINCPLDTDLMSQFFNYLLLPLIENQENQVQSLWQSQRNYMMYQIKAETVQVLSIFYKKFQHFESKKIMTYQQQDIQAQEKYIQNLIVYAQKINVLEIIRNALEVRIDHEQLKGIGLNKNILIQNKHILEVLKENQNISCKRFIMEYLNNALELFALLFDISSNFAKNNLDLQFNLIDELIDLFCFHEKFFSYKFGDTKEYYEVNMIVVLISLLCEPEINNQYSLDDSQKIFYQNIKLIDNFVEQIEDINDFVTNVSFNTVVGGYQYCTNWKKSTNIQNSIFLVLTSIMKFWQAQDKVSTQTLQEYLSGHYNRLPFAFQFESFLNQQIIHSIHAHHEGVIDFLITCQKNSFEIISNLFQLEAKQQKKDITIVALLRLNLELFKNLIGRQDNLMNYDSIFILKLILFILKIFNENRFSNHLKNLVNKGLFDLFQDLFFECFIRGDNVTDLNFAILSQLYQQQQKNNEPMTFDNINIINFVSMHFLKQQQILICEIGQQFVNLFEKSFYLQIQSKYNYIFSTKNTYFYQNICNNLHKLVTFTSDELATTINQEFMSDIAVQIEQYLSDLNQTGNNYYQENTNYFQSIVYAFQNASKSQKQLNSIQNEYNPNSIYLTLKNLQKDENQCKGLLMVTQIYNILQEIDINKKQLQEQLIKLYQVIFQIGFSGFYQSCNLSTIPVHGSCVYALQVQNNIKNFDNKNLDIKQDKISAVEIEQILKKNNFDIKNAQKHGNLRDKQIFDVLDFENQLLFSCLKNKFDLSLVHIYYKNQFNNIEDIQIKSIKENVLSSIKDMYQMIHGALKNKEKNSFVQNQNLLRFLNFHLKSLNYFHVNLFNIEQNQENESFIDIILHILQILLEFKSNIFEIFEHQDHKSQYYFETIFYCLNYLCLVQFKGMNPTTQNMYVYLQDFVTMISKTKYNTKKMILLLNCLTLATKIESRTISIEHIDQLSELLSDKNQNFEVFNLLINYFKTILHIKSAQNQLLSSNVYRKLSISNCITEDDDYDSSEFYSENRVKKVHSKFIKLLNFFNESCIVYQDFSNFKDIAFKFFENYHQRIIKIISFSENKAHENRQFTNYEIPESFRTLAALSELQQVMILIAYLSQFLSTWKQSSANLVNIVGQILMKKTTQLFAKAYFYNNKNPNSLSIANTISEKIIPKTTLEIQMQKICLQELPNDNIANHYINDSIQRSSALRQTIQSSNRMNTLITSLFSLRTDCKITSIMFYLGMILINFMNDSELFQKLSLSFKNQSELQNFHMKFSQTIIDCQSFVCFMTMKLFRHSKIFLETNLKLRYLYSTEEAYQQMLGANDCEQFVSLTEQEELFRKSFEIVIFLHIAYVEAMKSSHSTLYEFNMNHYTNNIKQTKEELRKYQSINPSNEQFQTGSTRRSLSNSRFRSAQRRSLTSPMADYVQRDPNTEESLQKKKDLAQHQANMEFLASLLH